MKPETILEQNLKPTVLVWDMSVRLFHWLLVTAIAVAGVTGFLAGPRWIDVHLWAGIVAAALVSWRIVWGILGGKHARFADFIVRPTAIAGHARKLYSGTAERHIGHNPLGGAMIVAILLTIIVIGASGVITLGGVLKTGPLAFTTSFALGQLAKEAHELLANLLLVLLCLHIAGVIFESYRTRENLARTMISGRKEIRDADHMPIQRRGHPFLAASIAGGLLAASAGAIWWLTAKPALGVPPQTLNPIYAEECSACHIPYHPSLLPRASWTKLMADLEDHFGENAELDAVTKASISTYLQENAAETYDTKPANVFRRVDVQKAFTITASPYWKRRHGDLPDRLFARKSVGSRGNCEACHADARPGRFYPGSIDIPEEVSP